MQEMLILPIRVVDADGRPVAGAEVIPWALRCSKGHGRCCKGGIGDCEPPKLITNADGRADVPYPRDADVAERVRTTQVTLSIDHPDFALISYEFVDVPKQDESPHSVTLQRGISVEIVPIEDGRRAALEGLYALWSDGRSWKRGVSPTMTEEGGLRLPMMPSGPGEVLLVRLDEDRATHFSSIVDFDAEAGAAVREQVDLHPAVRIIGALSDNVPRPVRNGRLQAETLPAASCREKMHWLTWVPIAADGTFVIDGWPAGEAAQIIALCDGYIAESGAAPDDVEQPHDPDPFLRPQVFLPLAIGDPIVLRMTPMARCEIETVDENGARVVGARVYSCPNVGWWNVGSNVYCTSLVRGERLLVERDYRACTDKVFLDPFKTSTDANGRGELELPVGKRRLYASHGDYELSSVFGRRERDVELVAGATTTVRLVLQPKGQEHIGEWDKVRTLLSGCRGPRSEVAPVDPSFRDKLLKIREQLIAAEDPTDPLLLYGAYSAMAEAFDELGDEEEAAKWRRKAAEQTERRAATKT